MTDRRRRELRSGWDSRGALHWVADGHDWAGCLRVVDGVTANVSYSKSISASREKHSSARLECLHDNGREHTFVWVTVIDGAIVRCHVPWSTETRKSDHQRTPRAGDTLTARSLILRVENSNQSKNESKQRERRRNKQRHVIVATWSPWDWLAGGDQWKKRSCASIGLTH